MPKKINHISLSNDESLQLRRYVQGGHKSARAINRARILLFADAGMTDDERAEPLGVGLATVYRVRKRYQEVGWEKALQENPRSGAPAKIDG
jgi:transposase